MQPYFDVNSVRSKFPILKTKPHGQPLTYLDNAASTQKPDVVIDSLTHYYQHTNANVHRGVHYLSELATEAYENTRKKVQHFINARSEKECIFVRGTTEAINLVANSFGDRYFQPGDEILLSQMEHHSNIVPWQLAAKRHGASIKIIPLQANGELDLSNLDNLLTAKTKIIGLVYASNSLGTINPVRTIIEAAHQQNIPVLIDGAQASAHLPVDVRELGCDFYTLSSHKMYGPMGVGVLYGKEKWLEEMPPFQGGGEMILSVTFEESTYNTIPHKFEAGTPAVADVIGLGAAIDFLSDLNTKAVSDYENNLLNYATDKLSQIEDLKIIGTAKEKISVISFVLDDIHPHDIGTIVDQSGVAIRTGNHCTMPVMSYFNIAATARASIGLFNTHEDIDRLVDALLEVKRIFKKRYD